MLTHGKMMRKEIAKELSIQNKKIIVLDDDPTGVQTMHDIDVVTQWDHEWIKKAFQAKENVFYILTNTRSYQPEQVEDILSEIVKNVHKVSQELNIPFEIVNRGDSTLRGHYPLEVDVLTRELERTANKKVDGHLLIPAFFESGRYTIDNVHYLKENNKLVPIEETEFAQDEVFGFSTSNLPRWIEEKTNQRYLSHECMIISLKDFEKGIDRIVQLLMNVNHNTPVVINASSYKELDILSMALNIVTKKGKFFLYRSAASFVKSYSGTKDIPYLNKEILFNEEEKLNGGIVIVGSHVKKSSEQLSYLQSQLQIKSIELDVERLLNKHAREGEINRATTLLNQYIEANENAVLYSSRKLIKDEVKINNLLISQSVSLAITSIVQNLRYTPKFIIAKGGITSSDIATKGLNIKKAKVLGQVASGIPVWKMGKEAKFPNVPYIVFPGNVGERETLKELVLDLI
ncbi:four-carbon acid sugar kinase family protein [Priestia megaterium]|uniref:four-carbon acid sugar kinase family protein n=1 Tax=Priestia megaterium TaxID=1404 RepID=UPI0036729638